MSSNTRMKYCPFCGTKIIENAKFCMECGSQLPILNSNSIEKEMKTDTTSINANDEINDNITGVNNVATVDNITEVDRTVNLDNNLEIKDKTDVKNSSQSVDKKPRKNFSLLKKQELNRNIIDNQTVNNNFEVNRLTYINNEQNTQNSNDNIEKANLTNTYTNINYSTLQCPSCNDYMQLIEKSGILSGGKYYSCNNCNLTFRETNDSYTLYEEPENTRFKHKLHLKRYPLSEWKRIINGNYSSEDIKEINNMRFDKMMNKFCPVCDNQLERYKSGAFSSKSYLVCSVCSTVLKEEGNKFTLYNTADTFSPLWRYVNTPLKLAEMRKIIINEETPENKKKRELIIKNNKAKIRKQKNEIRQKNEDVSSFIESFKSGTATLHVPNTGVMLKKNETPIYAVYDVTLREPRAVRKSTGGYGGASIRIAKGVTLHTGRTGSTSQSHDEIKDIDRGKLLITNKRLIFLGNNRTTNIDLNKIVAITSTKDMIQVQRSNKQKPEYFNNVKRKQNITVDGRVSTVEIDGDMIKELIMGLTFQ